MTIITTEELDLAYDEDTLEEAAARIMRDYQLHVEHVATPSELMAMHGAWPVVRLIGDVKNVVRFLMECYSTGDDHDDLWTLRYALGLKQE